MALHLLLMDGLTHLIQMHGEFKQAPVGKIMTKYCRYGGVSHNTKMIK